MAISWEKFIQTREGASVRAFFIKLNKDIAQDDTDESRQEMSGSKKAVPKKQKLLLLNTKKGYWLYKLFEREESKVLGQPIVHAVSDRFAKKQTDGSFWRDKIVYLVDDTLTHGYSLGETYELLSRWMNEKDICPIVFALNEDVDLEDKNEHVSENKVSFWRNLRYYIKMSQDDMGHFCTDETKMMHAENIPYVIDLPYLKDEMQEERMNFKVVLTQEQFIALQEENEQWEFRFNSFQLQYDEDREVLRGFIIETKDEQLLAETRQFISDYIITGTYSEDEEQKVHLVFVPFAIAHSVSMDVVERIWNAFMGEEYVRKVNTERDSGYAKQTGKTVENNNLWRRRYRECVYVLSMEIAERFKVYLESLAGIKLGYDYKIVEEHFSREFIEKAKEIEKERRADSERICKVIRSLKNDFSEECTSEEGLAGKDNVCKEEYLEEAAYSLIFDEVMKRKQKFLADHGAGKKVDVLEYGEICTMLDKKFLFRTEKERRYAFTRIIVTLLQTSTCSGRLFVDFKRHMIEKGVRYGENSDLLLPYFDLKFYWAVLLLVEKEGKEAALKSYDRLARGLEKKYKELGLYGDRFSEQQFSKNKEYFRMVLDNDFQLYNKYFYLEPYFRGKWNEADMMYMKKIEEFVEKF